MARVIWAAPTWLAIAALCAVTGCTRPSQTQPPTSHTPSSTTSSANTSSASTSPIQETQDDSKSRTAGGNSSETSDASGEAADEVIDAPIDKIFKIPESWTRLGKGEVWIDKGQHLVAVGGYICLRAGMLEMFACPQHTREHESIVAVTVPSRIVHAALLAVGAKPGAPVQYDPEYKSATGPKVRVSVRWMENGKEQHLAAQQMIRQIRSQKPMEDDWVFGGSGTWQDDDGRTIYMADGGELVCVSNFGSAMLDLPVESSADSGSLMFEAWTEKIPDLGTRVLLILEPEVSTDSSAAATTSGTP